MKLNLLGISLTVAFVLLTTAPIWLNAPESFASSPIWAITEQTDRQF